MQRSLGHQLLTVASLTFQQSCSLLHLRSAVSTFSSGVAQVMPRRQITVPTGPFPSHGLLPKDETQASAFLKRFPNYDGRGVRVAVLDTGVDPAAWGLNGAGKVVDIIDCTGSGDIPLKVVKPIDATSNGSETASEAIVLPALSGRHVLVSPKWSNPSGVWKVGVRRAFDLWPKDLVNRRTRERKPEWDVKLAKLLSEAKQELEKHEKATKDSGKKDEASADSDKPTSDSGAAESPAKEASTDPVEPVKPEADSAKKDQAVADAATQDQSSAVPESTLPQPSDPDTSTTSTTTEKLSSDEDERADATKGGAACKKKQDTEDQKKQKAERDAVVKRQKVELEARVTYLSGLNLSDPGPILDVVVWNDGKDWRVVVGGAEGDGEQNIAPGIDDKPSRLDLRNHKPMTDFHKEKHFERFGTQDLMSYSVNVVDDGEIVSLVAVSGTHGTHVAAIIGGNVEGDADASGVAPGVEIVSLKIGDTRLGSMETGQALLRACKAIIDTKCDICNMSYGEDGAWGLEDRGQFIAMLRDEVIKKRNVVFVAAAGNSGPALSTVGAPSGTTGIISVGAYETPSMQQAEYAMLDNVPEGPYTWSSRGPMYDGENIVVYAPGAAITGVPTYNLQHTQLMNGTSMASPNACGAISLVLSALKADNIPYTPAGVIRAIKATAKDVDDPQNIGLIQVEALHKHLVDGQQYADAGAELEICVRSQSAPMPDFSKPPGMRGTTRGIYLREKLQTDSLYEAAVFVKPSFSTNKDTEKLYNLDMKVALVSTVAWVRTPSFVSIPGGGRNFNVRVDPAQLQSGLHCAEIRGYDTASSGRLLFSVPVTVCKPQVSASPTVHFDDWQSSPGAIERKFIAIPSGATWAKLHVTSRGHDAPLGLWLHCVQLQPEVRLSKTEFKSIINLTAGETSTRTFNVVPGTTMELCMAQFWNSLPSATVSVQLDLHGLSISHGGGLTIRGGGPYGKIQVSSSVRPEELKPSVSFNDRVSYVRPSDSKITALGDRDVMPDGQRLYQLVNTYSFKLTEKTKIKISWPVLGNLYDVAMSALYVITDVNDRVMKFGGAYSSAVDLMKGDYTVKLQLQHSSHKALEALKDLQLSIAAQLGDKLKKLTLPVYADHVDAVEGIAMHACRGIQMSHGETRALILGSELRGSTADLYKVAKAGDFLSGKILLGPAATSKAQCDITYAIPAQAKTEKEEEGPGDDPLLVDLQLSIVDKIKDDDAKTSFLDSLQSTAPNHLPLLVARLKAIKDDAKPEKIVEAADVVLAALDENEIALFAGRKAKPADEQTPDDKKAQKAMNAKKAAWSLAYSKKLLASYKSKATLAEQQALLDKYRLFADNPDKDQDLLINTAKKDITEGRYGSALKHLGKAASEVTERAKKKEVKEMKLDCIKKLGWTVLTEYHTRFNVRNEPALPAVW